jgi:hypothetical protein
MKMEQSVPKRRHLKFRRRGITQKEAHNSPTQKDAHNSPTQKEAHNSPTQKEAHNSPTQKEAHYSPTQIIFTCSLWSAHRILQ